MIKNRFRSKVDIRNTKEEIFMNRIGKNIFLTPTMILAEFSSEIEPGTIV